ncbi:hypothetical protein ACJIZ3_014281 [Penstemon smallii]|uniref:Uncharacterized protein n=1 Tax=Penstemon smallii TaxID=265156 RepID=A0ABD3RJH2_9LAMI
MESIYNCENMAKMCLQIIRQSFVVWEELLEKKEYYWEPKHEAEIKRIFDVKAGSSLTHAFDEEYKAYWVSPEFLEKSQRNKRNRASNCDGQGAPNHTGGSITHSEHARRLRQKGQDVSQASLFMYTHSKYDENGEKTIWVDERSKNTYVSQINSLLSLLLISNRCYV